MHRKKIHRHLNYFPWYLNLLRKLKRIKINQRRTTLYHTLEIFFDNVTKNGLLNKANGVAFSFTMAIFPSIIFIFTLIPYIHWIVPRIDSGSIMQFISNVMPEQMYSVANETIQDIVSIKRQGLLSFGGILALILATNGMHSLMATFNSIYKTNEKKRTYPNKNHCHGIDTCSFISVVFLHFPNGNWQSIPVLFGSCGYHARELYHLVDYA